MPGGEQDMQSQSTFDDDRLVAYVLGLADDPELRAAAAEDGALQKHLARIGAELEQVHEQLDLAVPTPDPTWADLSSERWQKLQPYVRTHQRTSRRRFGWRLLAPALTAAAAVALALGIVLSDGDLRTGTRDTAADGAKGVLSSGDQGEEAANGGRTVLPTEITSAYQVVAVARAGDAAAGRQTFAVLRTLKGSSAAIVTLIVGADGDVPAGRVVVLLLRPEPDAVSSSRTPGTAPHATDAPSSPNTVTSFLYRLDDAPAEVLLLPQNVSPDGVILP